MEKLCDLKHETIDKNFLDIKKITDDHDSRIDKLEQNSVRLQERLDNLIKQLAQLNSTLRWFMGLIIGAIVAFFFYAIQQNIFN